MSVRTLLKLGGLWLAVLPVFANGFSGLGSSVEGFTDPLPGTVFKFPEDHGPHPDYRIEWWYLTANLEDSEGIAYGLQWTLFRSAMRPENPEGWISPQIWFGHAAITTTDRHFATERFARGGIGQAGVKINPFNAWIDDWSMRGPNLKRLSLTASGPEFHFEMSLNSDGPLIFHGKNGFSIKSETKQASYYYSQPFYHIEGTLTLPDGPVQVQGNAWLDREWSSQPLGETQSGWDWFSLSFDNGNKLMGFQLREADGGSYSAATWIEPNGTTETFQNGAFIAEPLEVSQVAGHDVPTRWRVRLPRKRVDVIVGALNPNAWMEVSIPYWEGPVKISGSHQGKGYLEMTGYD